MHNLVSAGYRIIFAKKTMKKIIAVYSLMLGISVLAMWTVLLTGGAVTQGTIETGFHLYAEFIMAVICIVSGGLMLANRPLSVETNIAGHAMVVYSVLNAAGYYGEKGNLTMMYVFLTLFVLSVSAISIGYQLLKSKR